MFEKHIIFFDKMIKRNHFGYKLFRCEMNKIIHKQILKIFIYSAIILLTFFSSIIFCARDNFYSYFSKYEGVERMWTCPLYSISGRNRRIYGRFVTGGGHYNDPRRAGGSESVSNNGRSCTV